MRSSPTRAFRGGCVKVSGKQTALEVQGHVSGFETRAIHVDQEPDPLTGAIIPSISLTTTFLQDEPGKFRGDYDYGRAGTPIRTTLERVVNSLENASYGNVYASGLAAEDAILRLIGATDHLLLPLDAYGGTFRLIDKIHVPHGLQYTPVDFHDLDSLVDAWRPNTKMVWFETPSNPSLAVIDIEKVVDLAHERGALVVVDNTFASPYLQNPLDLGADIVVHSMTKYICGHSDVTAGYAGTNDAAIGERLYFHQKAVGAILSPLDCYLALRGVKTLAIRMERHCDNAEAIAEFLAAHPKVKQVMYPGLATHPQHALATKQMRRYGGMLSFEPHGDEEVALKLVTGTKIFHLAESLGAVESLIEHPHRMTHASVAGTDLEISSSLIRLSIGIETVEDLIADLAQALEQI